MMNLSALRMSILRADAIVVRTPGMFAADLTTLVRTGVTTRLLPVASTAFETRDLVDLAHIQATASITMISPVAAAFARQSGQHSQTLGLLGQAVVVERGFG